jgi:hypothetical protein
MTRDVKTLIGDLSDQDAISFPGPTHNRLKVSANLAVEERARTR